MLRQVTRRWLRLPTTKEAAKNRCRRSRMTRKTKLLLVVEGPSMSIRERERERERERGVLVIGCTMGRHWASNFRC